MRIVVFGHTSGNILVFFLFWPYIILPIYLQKVVMNNFDNILLKFYAQRFTVFLHSSHTNMVTCNADMVMVHAICKCTHRDVKPATHAYQPRTQNIRRRYPSYHDTTKHFNFAGT